MNNQEIIKVFRYQLRLVRMKFKEPGLVDMVQKRQLALVSKFGVWTKETCVRHLLTTTLNPIEKL